MASYRETGKAVRVIRDNEDAPWELLVSCEYDVEIEDGEASASLRAVRLYRWEERISDWDEVPFDYLNPWHWDDVTNLIYDECRCYAVEQAKHSHETNEFLQPTTLED